ncbi:MAG: aldo/keto reductase, partial [Candidatus Margulisbacteria bacterium]|nr:aldo/keto reductase [Candidatus Margulisiibacteriota bacterium]
GTSEAVLGQFLRKHHSLARDMIIATKCGMLWKNDGTTPQDFSPESMREAVENSLRLLGGHIHLLQLHSINMDVLDREESLKVLEYFRGQGDVDFVGATCTRPPEAAMKAAFSGRFDTLQVQYNPLDQSMAKAIRIAGEQNLGVIVNRPLATGLFSNKSQFAADPKQRDAARQIQAQSGAEDLAAYSWKFVFDNPHVTLALIGTRDIGHLRENIRGLNR